MEQNKVRTYLLYALGEIFLVVFGILIAIWVSNWNEDRVLEDSATYHLGLLSNDLEEDKELSTRLIATFEQNQEGIYGLLNTLKRLQSVRPILQEDIVRLMLEYNFRPRNSALNVLVNTGEIGALDIKPQNLISNYYRSVDAIEERDLITNANIQTKLEPHIFDNYNYLFGRGNTFPILQDIYKDDKRTTVSINEEQLLTDKKLEALLVARLYQNRKLLELYNIALENLNELQFYIEEG
jgi:hypothetical protein